LPASSPIIASSAAGNAMSRIAWRKNAAAGLPTTVTRTPAAVASAVTKGPLSSDIPSAVLQAVLRCIATSFAPFRSNR
jgi:hypothetical protein